MQAPPGPPLWNPVPCGMPPAYGFPAQPPQQPWGMNFVPQAGQIKAVSSFGPHTWRSTNTGKWWFGIEVKA
eukprot:3945707-Amphidinium_carterae.1